MMLTISHRVRRDIRGIIVAEAGERHQLNLKSMNSSQFSLANRKQLADVLNNDYNSLRSQAKNKLREKRQALEQSDR